VVSGSVKDIVLVSSEPVAKIVYGLKIEAVPNGLMMQPNSSAAQRVLAGHRAVTHQLDAYPSLHPARVEGQFGSVTTRGDNQYAHRVFSPDFADSWKSTSSYHIFGF